MIDVIDFRGYKFITDFTPPPPKHAYWTVSPRGPGYFDACNVVLRHKYTGVSFPLGYVALVAVDTYDAESCYSSEEVDER